jgi:hypothetical protein
MDGVGLKAFMLGKEKMIDITKCSGENCPKKNTCTRYMMTMTQKECWWIDARDCISTEYSMYCGPYEIDRDRDSP